ncbi:MAG: hypothetical protein NWE76_03395 [Candidatus Bathyarchaeota archaeon]|nr:hypothetical protein [Candidatus Bathyarchaeota archaeon]
MADAKSDEKQVMYINVDFKSGSSKQYRIPVVPHKDDLDEQLATYERVLDAVHEAYMEGDQGIVQILDQPKGWSLPKLLYIGLWAVDSITLDPPRLLKDDK